MDEQQLRREYQNFCSMHVNPPSFETWSSGKREMMYKKSLTQSPATVDDDKCEMGCKNYYGGEIRHHKDCVFYPESLSEMYEKIDAEKSTPQPSPANEKQVAALALADRILEDVSDSNEDQWFYTCIRQLRAIVLSQPAQPVVSESDPDCKCFPSYLCNHCENMAALENDNG